VTLPPMPLKPVVSALIWRTLPASQANTAIDGPMGASAPKRHEETTSG
jgi:hypothetical protein